VDDLSTTFCAAQALVPLVAGTDTHQTSSPADHLPDWGATTTDNAAIAAWSDDGCEDLLPHHRRRGSSTPPGPKRVRVAVTCGRWRRAGYATLTYPDAASHAFTKVRNRAGVAADVHLHSLQRFQAILQLIAVRPMAERR
jgi:hypothetical protein